MAVKAQPDTTSKSKIGALVEFCGHNAVFVADIIEVAGACVVRATGPIMPMLDRNPKRVAAAEYHVTDFPSAGFWRPELGVLVVPSDQCRRRGEGIIPHTYVAATENIAHFMADACDRQAVTVKFLYENPDLDGYLFAKQSYEQGLDAWIALSGVDKLSRSEDYVVEYGRISERRLAGTDEVFVSRKQLLAELGIETKPGGVSRAK